MTIGTHQLPLPGGAPASKKGGVAPSTITRLVRCAGRGGDTRGAAPLRLSQRTQGIRSNPRPIRLSR